MLETDKAMTAYLRCLLVCLLVIAVPGCRKKEPQLGQVQGTVLWKNEPLPNARVIFVPDSQHGTEGQRSTAVTDNTGRYALVCDNGKPGAVVGRHRIVIVVSRRSDRAAKGDERIATRRATKGETSPKLLIPTAYRSPQSTPILREVQPGSQTIDLKLP